MQTASPPADTSNLLTLAAERTGYAIPAPTGVTSVSPSPSSGLADIPAILARISPDGRLLTDRDLERITGQKRQTWRLRRMRGDCPVFIRLGGRVYYTPSAVVEYLKARAVSSTSEETVRRQEGAR